MCLDLQQFEIALRPNIFSVLHCGLLSKCSRLGILSLARQKYCLCFLILDCGPHYGFIYLFDAFVLVNGMNKNRTGIYPYGSTSSQDCIFNDLSIPC